jgi:hypothetical protein
MARKFNSLTAINYLLDKNQNCVFLILQFSRLEFGFRKQAAQNFEVFQLSANTATCRHLGHTLSKDMETGKIDQAVGDEREVKV